MRLWAPSVTPRWLASVAVAVAVAIGCLTLTLDHDGLLTPLFGDGAGSRSDRALSTALVLVTIAAWFGEAGGLRWPRPIFVAAAALPVAALLAQGEVLIVPLFLLLLVAWSGYVDRRRTSLLTLAAALAVIVPPMAIQKETPGDWIPWLLALVMVWLAAYALSSQQRLLLELRAAQAGLAQQAAAEERRRIAREVHDVVAHALAVTLLHLTGARHVLMRDPQQAAEALATAEQLGRQSLADIRRTVGLLAAGRSDDQRAPLPDATDIRALVDSYATAGLAVRLTLDGDPARLSAAAGLGVYRIAQEALANVAKHAPGAEADVTLRIGRDAATLRVSNGAGHGGPRVVAANGGPGLGIAGMRERAALLGGSLETRPSGGGWLVECRIPIAAVARATVQDDVDGNVAADLRPPGR